MVQERVRAVRVAAIMIRRTSDEGAGYRDGLRRESWQVVIPEIVLDALSGSGRDDRSR